MTKSVTLPAECQTQTVEFTYQQCKGVCKSEMVNKVSEEMSYGNTTVVALEDDCKCCRETEKKSVTLNVTCGDGIPDHAVKYETAISCECQPGCR